MKKTLFLALSLIIMLASICCLAAENPVTVSLDGKIIDCESYGSPATIVDGRTLVPLRAIFEALGASVEWDSAAKTVTSTLDSSQIKLTIGSKTLYKNGTPVELDVAAAIINNRTMVPARAVAESFGVKVEWDKTTRNVILTSVPKSLATLAAQSTAQTNYEGIEILRGTFSCDTEAFGKKVGKISGQNTPTIMSDYFSNFTASKDMLTKNLVLSVMVYPNDSVKSILLGTGVHAPLCDAIYMSQLTENEWNRLTLVYNTKSETATLYINDKQISTRFCPLRDNQLRVIFSYSTDTICDSFIYYDDYYIYSGDVAVPAIETNSYIVDNLTINGYGNATAGQFKENLIVQRESYSVEILDENGNILEDNDKVTRGCNIIVYDGSIPVSRYFAGYESHKISNEAAVIDGYKLSSSKYGKGKVSFSACIDNYLDDIEITAAATLYNSEKAIIASSEKTLTVSDKAVVCPELDIESTDGTYVELTIKNAKTGNALCNPIVFTPFLSNKIEVVTPLYEGFTSKAATFSYDDCLASDKQLIDILDKYGAKATFNLVSSKIVPNLTALCLEQTGKSDEKSVLRFAKQMYSSHELAAHSVQHLPSPLDKGEVAYSSTGQKLVGVSIEELLEDTLGCPEYLKENLDASAIGIAWPNGYATDRSDYSSHILPAIQNAGIKYARAIENSQFLLPDNWYEWNATCHHNDAPVYAKKFSELENKGGLKCLFIWGHTYEFDDNKSNDSKNWTMIENVISTLSKNGVWFATCGEIYNYVEASKMLEIKENSVKNNSKTTIYVNINGENVTLSPNETFSL